MKRRTAGKIARIGRRFGFKPESQDQVVTTHFVLFEAVTRPENQGEEEGQLVFAGPGASIVAAARWANSATSRLVAMPVTIRA